MENVLQPVGRFESIVLASDGTEHSEGAKTLAFSIAKACSAELLIIRIVLTNPEYEYMAPDRVEQETQAAQESLEAMQAEAQAMGISCRIAVRHGVDPYMGVVNIAEESHADCVVVGRRHRSDLARLLVGDSTAKMIGHAACNVLVTSADALAPQQGILVATDGSRQADAACMAAARLATEYRLPLKVVSVAQEASGSQGQTDAGYCVERVITALAPALADVGVAIEGLVEVGRADEAINEAARRHGADLVVVGSHGRTGLQRLIMGSVSERVVAHASSPVLVVK
ncbi:Nucleotide-binding universal stress protein, UspA family [Ectothiorhodosinus mongolicus]|uniref:Nucleotide-binding universal stress protein, UspA family n=1 Tax=Ectothiorhodosinus mongolicus TaxID=233100 RepID=A0A1R3VZ73_9GAMM|nr:universal stress protein [Ectothiorhodosinus mongolicus]ULX57085.1 universal stress protein [Ectothiorhodosinus mongolicus]SIT69833.1 Nucleotide-binding universal stress protein, UspA family [Ectothiorhodosinus mongolicus]